MRGTVSLVDAGSAALGLAGCGGDETAEASAGAWSAGPPWTAAGTPVHPAPARRAG